MNVLSCIGPFIVLCVLGTSTAFPTNMQGQGRVPGDRFRGVRDLSGSLVSNLIDNQELHGTVNVILANDQGLVVVTDSYLSNNGQLVADGQKLFVIDDHTVCSIAGFYSDPGPSMDGVNFPASMVIPSLMKQIQAQRSNVFSASLEYKMFAVSRSLLYSLNALQAMKNRSEPGRPPGSRLEITIATYEDGHPKMSQVTLLPVYQTEGYVYQLFDPIIKTGGSGTQFLLAGIRDVGEAILSRQTTFTTNNPVLAHYDFQMAKDEGKSLTVTELLDVAKQVELLTAASYSQVVGGFQQSAVLVNGKIAEKTLFPRDDTKNLPPPALIHIFNGIKIYGRDAIIPNEQSFIVSNPHIAVLFDADMAHVTVNLQNILFFKTRLTHCRFQYVRSNNFILDKSNIVTNSRLILSDGADRNSKSLLKIHQDFPDLKIMTTSEEFDQYLKVPYLPGTWITKDHQAP